jgi:Arc/MetJ-type ribon-helix-helix transcriptional regulator
MLKNRRNIVSLALSEELADMMLEHWIDNGYASASEYIRELIRNDLRQNGKMPEPTGAPRVRFSDNRFRKPGR